MPELPDLVYIEKILKRNLFCGTTIRRVGVLGYDVFFCPRCQPPAREQFINWK